jgi:hypothetical protein
LWRPETECWHSSMPVPTSTLLCGQGRSSAGPSKTWPMYGIHLPSPTCRVLQWCQSHYLLWLLLLLCRASARHANYDVITCVVYCRC